MVYFGETDPSDGKSYINLDNGGGSFQQCMQYKEATWYHFKMYLDWTSGPPAQAILTVDAGDNEFVFHADDDDGPYQGGDDFTAEGYFEVGRLAKGTNYESRCNCRYLRYMYIYNRKAEVTAYFDDIAFHHAEALEVRATNAAPGGDGLLLYVTQASSSDDLVDADNATACALKGVASDDGVVFTVDETTTYSAATCDATMLSLLSDDPDSASFTSDDALSRDRSSLSFATYTEPVAFTTVSTNGAATNDGDATKATAVIVVRLTTATPGANIVYCTSSDLFSHQCNDGVDLDCETPGAHGLLNNGEEITVRYSTDISAVACPEGSRRPSEGTVSPQYEVAVLPPTFMTVSSYPNVEDVTIKVTSASPGSDIIWTSGDGDQTNPSCTMDVNSSDWPARGKINKAGAIFSETPTVGYVTLSADTHIRAVACRSGNANSDFAEYSVEIMSMAYFAVIAVSAALLVFLTLLCVLKGTCKILFHDGSILCRFRVVCGKCCHKMEKETNPNYRDSIMGQFRQPSFGEAADAPRLPVVESQDEELPMSSAADFSFRQIARAKGVAHEAKI